MWLWGHEHRLAIYGKHAEVEGVVAHGRCLGHGGMPVELQAPKAGLPLRFHDERHYDNDENLTISFNGHANVILEGASMRINYVDLCGTVIFSEKWTSDDGTPRLAP